MQLSNELRLRILTHNIRYATSNPEEGEERWEVRRCRIVGELLFATRFCPEAFICLQEVLHRQLEDILGDLNRPGMSPEASASPEWSYIGVGREDGHQAGEYSPIFYRPAVWKLEMWRTVWLSETPDRPSKGWDAACIRIVTIGLFRHIATNYPVLATNTHLDDRGATSRYEAAKIILAEIGREQRTADQPLPVFLAGDLNSVSSDGAYQLLEGDESCLRDFRTCVPAGERYGHTDTFTGFGHDGEPARRIDFVFVGPREQIADGINGPRSQNPASPAWYPTGYSVLANRFDDRVYNSDHRAVVADVKLA